MYPLICQIGPFSIYSYGLMLALGFLVSVHLAKQKARRENFNPEIILNFAFLVFVFGIIGSRLLYIIQNITYYFREPREIIMLAHGGLSWFGGLFLGVISGILYLKKKRLPIYKTFDLIIPFVALGQAIGRIGCLLNGCCFGKVSKFGLYFKVHQSILIPTQLYSALILILIFIILRFLQERPHKDGEIFFVYLLLYSIKRFFIEFWRADNEIIFLGLTLFQIISILIFIFCLTKLFLIKKSQLKL
jgi:phosphatidylglycerol:prolipoprotein diacylglycerol transferase